MLLLTLLPVVGWAQHLASTEATYDGSGHSFPTVYLDAGETQVIPVSQTTYLETGYHNPRYRVNHWTYNSSNASQYQDAGTYTANIQRQTYSYGSWGQWSNYETLTFTVNKADVNVELYQVVREWKDPWSDPVVATLEASARKVTGAVTDWDKISGYFDWDQLQTVGDVGTYKYTLKLNSDPKNYNIYINAVGAELKVEKNTTGYWKTTATDNAALTYNGEEQTLAPSKDAEFLDTDDNVAGTIEYSLNGVDWSTDYPKAKDAGTYTVTYKGVGDVNHTDASTTKTYTVTINPYEITTADFNEPTPLTVTYKDAGDHKQVIAEAATWKDGTLKTELEAGAAFWYTTSTSLPVGDNVAKYDVKYTINVTDPNFVWKGGTKTLSTQAEITKADIAAADVTAPEGETGLEYILDTPQELIATAASCAKGTVMYSVDGGAWTNDLSKVVAEHVKANNAKYVVSWYVVGDPNHNDYGSTTEPAGSFEVGIAPIQYLLTATPTPKLGLVYNGAEQSILASGITRKSTAPKAAPAGKVEYYINGGAAIDGKAFANVKATDAGEYTVTWKVVPADAAYENDYIPAVTAEGDEVVATIDKYNLNVTGNQVKGTIEELYNLTGGLITPKFANAKFLEDITLLSVDEPKKAEILNAIVTPNIPAFQDLKVGDNTVTFTVVDDAENETNYRAVVKGTAGGRLTIESIEAAIQEPAEPKLSMVYTGEDLQLIGKPAVGYKAEAGTGDVAIGKVVYSLTEAGEYTDDLTKIVGKDADTYTVYYKVELDKENTATLDRFYTYTAAVKSFNATIDQKALDLAMFEFDPESQEAVYNGANQLPVITTKTTEPITTDDWYFEFADGKGNPIANPNEGVKNVDVYAVTLKAEADGNYKGEVSTTWEITKADATCSAPEPLLGLIYNGEDLALVAEPTYDGGTLEYSLDGTNWSEEIPTGKNADTYEVYYRVVADGNHNDFTCTDPVEATIAPKTLTKDMFVFEKTEQPFTGEPLKFEYAVADAEAAILTASDYVCEKDDVIIDADEYEFKFTGKENYSGTFTVVCTVTPIEQNVVAPKAINLTYNATDQALVTEGTTDAVAGSMDQPAGKIEYQVTFGNEVLVPWTEDYAAVVGYNAGEYQVKYRVTASEKNYTNPLIEGDVDVEILRANVGYMLSNLEKTWDGNTFTEEEVATVFTLYAGELFGPDVYDVPFVLTLPEDYKDAGTYTFKQAKVVFKEGYPENYKVNCSGTAEIVIDKADITADDFEAPSEKVGMIFNGTDIELVKAGEVTTEYEGEPIGTVLYATSEEGEYSEKVPTAKAAGEYEVWYYVKGDKNHNDTEAVKLDAVIATKAVDWAISFDDAIGEDALLYNTKNQMPKVEVTDGETKLVKGTDYTMTIAFTPANETGPLADFEPAELVNVGKYEFTFKGINNYNGEAIRTIEIAPADLAENVTMSKFEATKVYNAKDQKPTITLTYEGYTLEADKDFTVVAADEMINAGEYEFVFTAVAGGNYTGEAKATFEIEKKEAIAEAADATKVYNGTDAFKDLPVLTFKNIELADDPATAFTYEADAFVFDELSANVGTYAFTVDVEKIESDNYYVSQANGANFTITPAKLMVNWNSEADPFTKVYGEKDPELKATTANLDITGAVAGEEEDIAAQTAITRAEGEAVGEYAITLAAAENAKVFDNYEVQFTGADAAFVITPATVKVSIASLEKVYDGEAATIEVKAEDLIVTGLQNGDKKEDIFTTLPTATVADGKAVNVGTYEVTLAGAVAGDYEVEYMTSTFNITPRKITAATIDFQQIQAGQAVEDFIDPTAFTIEGVVEKDAKFFYVDVNPDYQDFDGVVTADPDTYEDGLVIAVADEVADNYTGYDKFYGELLVIAADAVVLNDNETYKTLAKKNATVTFSDRAINYGTWNVVALPFEASVAQISEAFGYAAVDVLNETASDGSIHFQVITSGSVPAYTPFIVKTTADEELVKKNFNQVVFHGVDIEAWGGENNAVTDAAKNKFWGTFQAETKIGGQKYWYMSKGAWKDARNFNIETKPITLKPFRAFVEFDEANVAAGARIYIEEPDGTETAIDAVEFNNMVNGDTYTVGGMKVNKAQKGVYIQNGKKIAVK